MVIPNNLGEKACTEFAIRFTESNLLIEYTLKLDLGNFLEVDYPRRIVEECLSVNDKLIFSRGKTLEVFLLAPIKQYVNKSIKRKTAKTMDIARSSLSDTELFLNNGFKTIFAKDLVALILKWFDEKFMVIYRADAIKVMRKFANPKENTVYIERTLTDAAKAFGVRSNALGYRQAADSDDVSLCSIFEDKKIAIQADAYESYGTIRFINEFPLVINAILNGGTLVMDEFDASIHPMALMNIINIFHNDEINIHHAQLIFNTHNPIFLDISYGLGYSNYTFELWIVLHKKKCNGSLTDRTQYLSHINQIFGEKFENLDQYKHENNFKRCLSKLGLDDVRAAIQRAKEIMKMNKDNGKSLIRHGGYEYYEDNPALTMHEAVEKILVECGLY